LPQGGDPYNGWGTGSLPESLRDTGRGFWNAGIGIVEGGANLVGGFAIPGAPDYVPFLDGFRATYEAPKFGAIIEVLGTLGTLKVLGEIGAATGSSRGGLAEARAARDSLADELAPLRGRAPATVTGGYNTRTGEVAARACGGGRCAEDHVVDALGGNKAEIRFTEAIRPRTGAEVPVCPVCEANYGRGAFPPGTTFKNDQ
jgi:hypothetical protein